MKITPFEKLYNKISIITDGDFNIEILDDNILIKGIMNIHDGKFEIIGAYNLHERTDKRYVYLYRKTKMDNEWSIVLTDDIDDENVVKIGIQKYNKYLYKIAELVYQYTGIDFNTNVIGIIPIRKYNELMKRIMKDIDIEYIPEE